MFSRHNIVIFAVILFLIATNNRKSYLGSILKDENSLDQPVAIFSNGVNMGPPNKNPSLNPDTKYLKKGRRAAVVSDVEICSNMGGKILQEYNATSADASVTVALCIGLVNMFSSGIGGGAFILSSKHDLKTLLNHIISIDAREQAPLLADKFMYNGSKPIDDLFSANITKEQLFTDYSSKFGGKAIAVPGELKGLYQLYKTHGSGNVSWKQLIMPVIELAENGWEVNGMLESMLIPFKPLFSLDYRKWPFFIKNIDDIERCEKLLGENNGSCLKMADFITSGDHIRRPDLAKTYRMIANNGSDAIFYDPEGPIVKSLVKTIKDNNGIIVKEDFLTYNVTIGIPHSTIFMNKYQVLAPHSSASSGISLLGGLNIMNNFFKKGGNNTNFAIGDDLQNVPTHRLIETLKWMGAARTKLGDIQKSTDEEEYQQLLNRISDVLGEEWSNNSFSKIDDHKTLNSWKDYNPEFMPINDNGTAHLSIVDQFNNSVSITTSVNLVFGSLVIDSELGILLNDQMDDFSVPTEEKNAFDLVPSIYNYIEPKKRPLSSMLPIIVFEKLSKDISNSRNNDSDLIYGVPHLLLGAAGGSRIYTTVFQALIRKLMYQMPLLETVAYPRLHHQLLPEILYMENYTGSAFKDSMKSKGHKIMVTESKSVMNAISRESDGWHAVSDWWRKQGLAWAA